MTMDSANPLQGWDLTAVTASGEQHGTTATDIYGCLFFHLRDELRKFCTQVTKLNINIALTQFDAMDLAPMLIKHPQIIGFNDSQFDRIETSNVADYIGMQQVLKDWGPLLNKQNRHAAILINCMNWVAHQPGAKPGPQSSRSLMMKAASLIVGVPSLPTFLAYARP